MVQWQRVKQAGFILTAKLYIVLLPETQKHTLKLPEKFICWGNFRCIMKDETLVVRPWCSLLIQIQTED